MAIKDENPNTTVPSTTSMDAGITGYEAQLTAKSATPTELFTASEAKPETAHDDTRTANGDIERAGTWNDVDKQVAQVTPESYYRDFSTIAELGLEDWRATEKSLVRRLDLTLMPTLWILYLNNYLDRTNIAQARLNGMDNDIGLSGDDYNLAVSILTIGYMLAQLPSNMLLTRVRPSIYLPVTCIVWSSVAIATAGVKNAQHLFVVRFFLGVLEAPLFPGAS